DEVGVVLSEDLSAVILAKGKKTLVTPVNSSGLFKAEAQKWGGRVIECLVGPPEIIKAVKKYRADFAYEESGKYFFSDCFLWADGLLASLKMLEVMAKAKKSLSQIRQSYPVYYQVKLAFACPWEKMPRRWVGKGEKLIMGDSWLFIRASGTEPVIRVFSDSPKLKLARDLAEKGKRMVEELCVE
ncbi:MAG: phosphoglucomutase, partial [Patescibacteria group bacterium]|nr:phosphoglucomutase [Patescibacteria group bacterium]